MNLTLGKRLRELPGPIMITGHTGFKGTWLTFLLERLNVPVVGLSLSPEKGSLFDRAKRTDSIREAFLDIRKATAVAQFMAKHQPSAIIHMAAQPLVLESYKTPRETFETNVMGTVNVLDSAFKIDSVRAIIVVTTDKVYRNDNSRQAFVETDSLAGKDPYSASKVGTESVVAAWQHIAKVSGGPKIISVRAGNVIGGGDWAENRLLPDLIRSFMSGEPINIRNPHSTRPCQHVLDPLIGYLLALEHSLKTDSTDAFNFGPDSKSLSVKKIAEIAVRAWPFPTKVDSFRIVTANESESLSLALDSEKARRILHWTSAWTQKEAVVATIEWWDDVLNNGTDPVGACAQDIEFALKNINRLSNHG